MSDLEDVFGPVISSYSSQQAVEDGVLVAVTKQDAVTRSVLEFLLKHTPMGAQPPYNWPVDMMGWFRAGSINRKDALKMIAKHGKEAQAKYEEQVRHNKALALSKGLIGKYERQAKQAEDQGSILKIFIELTPAEPVDILARVADCKTGRTQTMYLRPNEIGGVTLMFPEDN